MKGKDPEKRSWGCCRSPEGRSREGQVKDNISPVKGIHLVRKGRGGEEKGKGRRKGGREEGKREGENKEGGRKEGRKEGKEGRRQGGKWWLTLLKVLRKYRMASDLPVKYGS